jgi:hypothetical protein
MMAFQNKEERMSLNHPSDVEKAYREIHAYFSRPDARLANDGQRGCEYLTVDGNKCAVGCRIPAEWMEQRGVDLVNNAGTVTGLYESFPEISGIVGEPGSNLFRFHEAAQGCHDVSADVAEFLVKLEGCAISYGVSPFEARAIRLGITRDQCVAEIVQDPEEYAQV